MQQLIEGPAPGGLAQGPRRNALVGPLRTLRDDDDDADDDGDS